MHRLLLLTVVIASTVAVQAQPATISGTWAVSATVSGTQSDQTCSFTQKETELTGTCKGERGEVSITGKVDGKNVTWKFQIEYEGQILTPVYAGTLESPDKMSGTVDVQGMGVSGEFVATRAK